MRQELAQQLLSSGMRPGSVALTDVRPPDLRLGGVYWTPIGPSDRERVKEFNRALEEVFSITAPSWRSNADKHMPKPALYDETRRVLDVSKNLGVYRYRRRWIDDAS